MIRPFKRRIEYKKEYELFKLRMTMAGCICAALSLFIYSNRVTDAICAFLLIY